MDELNSNAPNVSMLIQIKRISSSSHNRPTFMVCPLLFSLIGVLCEYCTNRLIEIPRHSATFLRV